MAGALLKEVLMRVRRPPVDERCLARYERIFALDELRFTVAFGYKDARPARFVGDRYEKAPLVQRLLKTCPKEAPEGACGFARSLLDANLLEREVFAPDNQKRKLVLEIIHASAGPDDQENRENPFQKWLSENARERFLEGVRKSTVVLYNGHSRVGGGPDFRAPRINSNGAILYDDYRIEEAGLKSLLAALAAPGTEVEVLGLLSCASSQLFEKRLHLTKKNLAVWSSRELLYFADALEDSWNFLDALIRKECHPRFEKITSARSGMAGSKLSGF